jgi:alkanesulfonate monooxygenase SsuD/methylene tetrahydromethanopterin reductase-like flavin-dependent oxidoreductase (luciferase family)
MEYPTMAENSPHRSGRLDEFTESVEQLWQEEEQTHEGRDDDREPSSSENQS